MRKFTQRVLIAGAAEVAIIGAVGGVNLIGEAQADPTPCVNAAGLCPPQVTSGPLRSYPLICQPIGPKGGASCYDVTRRRR